MRFYEFRFEPIEGESLMDLLVGELLEFGFESFSEEENMLIAYLPESGYRNNLLKDLDFFKDHPGVKISEDLLEDKNWNEEWERNYQPVTIAGKCHVRAPFHEPEPGILFEIVIEPKMAFGTAHHETTQLMATWLMDLGVKGKEVLDMGCGTGILAILANKMGARCVIGIDNDEWAWQNALENFRLNGVESGEVIHGDSHQIESGRYDLILANINRNILLQDLEIYTRGLKKGGQILLSGFYESDRNAIEMESLEAGLNFTGIRTLNNWAVMLFKKEQA
jgi:ribosomal protein L11 methyltransferase